MVAEDSKEVKGNGDSKTVKDVDEKEPHGTGAGKNGLNACGKNEWDWVCQYGRGWANACTIYE